MIEVLPHQWVRLDLIGGYSIIGEREVMVRPTEGKWPTLHHRFESSHAAMEWVRGLQLIIEAHAALTGEEE